MRLSDKVAIITGAASGMGAATARRLGKEGAKVVIADMLTGEGQAVADEINATGGEAVFIVLNVTDEAGWKDVVEQTVRMFGRLDILVNNAGISGSATNDLFDSGLWDRVMAVNSTGVFLGRRQRCGRCRRTAVARSSIFPPSPASSAKAWCI